MMNMVTEKTYNYYYTACALQGFLSTYTDSLKVLQLTAVFEASTW